MRFLFPLTFLLFIASVALAEERSPNIVYIMSDELAYYELGHMGNPYLITPRIDAMAAEGLRFTYAYAASPVCAPLRGCLMTGKHSGHASVRSNGGGTALRADEETIASVLKQKNYATGGYGKWGAGGRDSTGVPEKHGFDEFFGYYDQVHAHSFYPAYLVRNSEEVVLPGNVGGRSGETYAHYPIMEAGLEFIRENRDRPFFAYFPITPPHGMYDIPADDPAWDHYKDAEWMEGLSTDAKNYAAMVTMVDRNVGEIIDLLVELGLEENTIVFFTGDNGGQDRFKSREHPRGFYGPNVDPETGIEFRGGKGNLYEGGLRIPFLVRWPGKIEAGRVSDLIFSQVDIMKTLADLTGTTPPADTDGLSILPEILGKSGDQPKHERLYWEYRGQTAVLEGRWKAIQPKTESPWELYDLSKDPSETESIADANPERLAAMQAFAAASHTPVREGTYSDPEQTRHQRDRRAKFGALREDPPKGTKMFHLKHPDLIPAEELSIASFSSENRANDRGAAYAIDRRTTSLWHSQFSPQKVDPPHDLVIDLGESREVAGVQYLARQDSGWNGAFKSVELAVADSAEGPFDAEFLEVEFTKQKEPQNALFETPVKGRFLRVRVLGDHGAKGFASAAEIGVIGVPE